MALVEFKDKPSTNSPINADNLNLLQNNVETAINEVTDDIIAVEYTQTYSVSTGSGTYGRVTVNASTPSGYTWVAYEIISNGYVNSIINWIISSTATQCQVAWYNVSNTTYENRTMTIKGIYKKA